MEIDTVQNSLFQMQILAGDYIDYFLGSALLLSTMAAAGLGNMVSDVAGIFCADVIEDRARVFKYGRQPSLSSVQRRLPSVVCAPHQLPDHDNVIDFWHSCHMPGKSFTRSSTDSAHLFHVLPSQCRAQASPLASAVESSVELMCRGEVCGCYHWHLYRLPAGALPVHSQSICQAETFCPMHGCVCCARHVTHG